MLSAPTTAPPNLQKRALVSKKTYFLVSRWSFRISVMLMKTQISAFFFTFPYKYLSELFNELPKIFKISM